MKKIKLMIWCSLVVNLVAFFVLWGGVIGVATMTYTFIVIVLFAYLSNKVDKFTSKALCFPVFICSLAIKVLGNMYLQKTN
ncbi:MAG: hypothetical protein COU81_01015 [Candidatus Portnoybacteria bacterium CG10_big_fil_rev_8_21_14_0_10_36_7]|uniref:Uncharacterized protein n=1 Tax=Candidatus Portnoybacteria bacterium CG10_big_fil_rev_8_21_14_0_10_36_7 TaxID=1974812 RepID=A0A2M8KEQ6_9BACT|nr:MAG: hypothetical protein COU81_01015 [Candidatus Portnoybacteria bacterium CG10_big_fil_rev_8_21_14_0_10_36_7]